MQGLVSALLVLVLFYAIKRTSFWWFEWKSFPNFNPVSDYNLKRYEKCDFEHQFKNLELVRIMLIEVGKRKT